MLSRLKPSSQLEDFQTALQLYWGVLLLTLLVSQSDIRLGFMSKQRYTQRLNTSLIKKDYFSLGKQQRSYSETESTSQKIHFPYRMNPSKSNKELGHDTDILASCSFYTGLSILEI